MTVQEERSPLVQEVLSGNNRELQLVAARGLLPVPPDLLVELQVALSQSTDGEVASAAADAIAETDPKVVSGVIGERTKEEVISYLALNQRHPMVLESILRLRGVPHWLLKDLAVGLEADLQEILLLRQDVIVEDPGILDALERNPELSAYSRRKIREYRDHLVPRERPREKEARELEREADDLSEDDVREAIAAAAVEVDPVGERDETTGLSESQIKGLPVPVRLKLSRGAPRTLRNILIRDANQLVALSVLQHNPLSESEVEQIANNRAVSDDVLEAIGRNRAWVRKYKVVFALVRNPRSPVGMAVRLVSRLSVRDLRNLARDRNVTDAVRSTAGRLYRIKQQ